MGNTNGDIVGNLFDVWKTLRTPSMKLVMSVKQEEAPDCCFGIEYINIIHKIRLQFIYSHYELAG